MAWLRTTNETDAYAGKLYYAEVLKERVRFLVF
jgi:hypothetical protein